MNDCTHLCISPLEFIFGRHNSSALNLSLKHACPKHCRHLWRGWQARQLGWPFQRSSLLLPSRRGCPAHGVRSRPLGCPSVLNDHPWVSPTNLEATESLGGSARNACLWRELSLKVFQKRSAFAHADCYRSKCTWMWEPPFAWPFAVSRGQRSRGSRTGFAQQTSP